MRLFSTKTKRYGTIAIDWWWPESGLVIWIGGQVRYKMWGKRRSIR